MSIESMVKALNLSAPLTAAEKLCLVGIANHDGDGGAWPSIATLARYVGVTERQVQRIIKSLSQLGMLTVDEQGGGTRNTRADRRPNRYVLHLDGVTPASPRDGDGVTSGAPRGDMEGTHGVTPMSPETSLNLQLQPSLKDNAPSPADVDAAFEQFWQMYGRIGPKQVARQSWERAVFPGRGKSAADPAAILDGLERWVRYWRQPGAASVKWPQGWLNERRWECDPPPLPGQVQGPPRTSSQEAFARYVANRNGGNR